MDFFSSYVAEPDISTVDPGYIDTSHTRFSNFSTDAREPATVTNILPHELEFLSQRHFCYLWSSSNVLILRLLLV